MDILIVWIVGMSLTLRCALDIGKLDIPINRKRIAILLVIFSSWIGAVFYTFFFKRRIHRLR